MKTAQIAGLALLIGRVILVWLYTAIQSLQEINLADIPLVVILGGGAIIIGVIALLISITAEQTSDMKKRKEEIKKEDFEP